MLSARGRSIRTLIAALQTTLVVVVLTVALAVGVVLHVTDWHARRIGLAREQLEAWAELSAHANRYSEQIAEVLLLGEEEMPDFQDARASVDQGLKELERVTNAEEGFMNDGPADRARMAAEFASIDQARTLYRELDRSVERLLALRAEGRLPEAISLLRVEIEHRFDAELDGLLASAMQEERAEVEEARFEATQDREMLRILMAVVAIIALGGTWLAGRRLRHSLVPPITALAEGAEALGNGDLSRRVAVDATGYEIGVLAIRFNAMASRIEDQQGRLMRHRAELETEVARRTKELEVANRRLRDLDLARVRFLGDLSHELRTPLTVLRGEAELALRGESNPVRQATALKAVMRQTAHMEHLVGDLLFLARSEADDAPLETRQVVLQDVAMEAVEDGASLARMPAEALLSDIWPEDPIVVRADPHRLKQALLIVIDNALKYAAKDRPAQVALHPPNEAGVAEVVVRNEGPGLAPNEVSRVFERFFRGRNARASDAFGSGLGLPIAKWIVERHGGTISLDSAPSGPTELRIALPSGAPMGHA